MRRTLLLLCCGAAASCGRGGLLDWPTALAPVDAPLRQALTEERWAFRYLTAAACNAWTRRLAFAADGGVVASMEGVTHGGESGCVTTLTTTRGRWTLAGARELRLDWPDGSQRFSGAVFDRAPQLVTHPALSLRASGKRLSTRGFLRQADGSWLDAHEQVVAGRSVATQVRARVTPPLRAEHDAAPCTLELVVTVNVDGATATETFTPPCRRLRDAATGWRAFGHLDRSIYRFDAVREAGVVERLPPLLASAVANAVVLALAVHDDQPDVAVSPLLSDEAIGWYEADRAR